MLDNAACGVLVVVAGTGRPVVAVADYGVAAAVGLVRHVRVASGLIVVTIASHGVVSACCSRDSDADHDGDNDGRHNDPGDGHPGRSRAHLLGRDWVRDR